MTSFSVESRMTNGSLQSHLETNHVMSFYPSGKNEPLRHGGRTAAVSEVN